jgi:hypothetical protein
VDANDEKHGINFAKIETNTSLLTTILAMHLLGIKSKGSVGYLELLFTLTLFDQV